MLRYTLAAVLMTAVCVVSAQVEVIDRSPASRSAAAPSSNQAAAPVNGQQTAELYYQLQLLQQEVLELRGLVEQQAHELKRLKQQRLDDYLDLDRRLSQLSGTSSNAKPANSSTSTTTAASNSDTAASSSKDELKSYRDAIDLVLKKQDYDAAIVKLKEHLANFPRGRYAGNALYWLGEIYLLKGELENSRQWFVQLLTDFPNHPKEPDAQFKLGKVYYQLGDKSQSKALLQEAAKSKGNVAKLAQDYLKANFDS
ncbi:tol-pal system protein YbgF [Alteromonadaceae bacterium 2753L.S.0a.02]|nr:tol-pal system protein YbgF [Alteromonadaceae bacterium 2753L.S.0a.02]